LRTDITAEILTSRHGYGAIGVLIVLIIFQFRYGVVPAWRGIHSDFPNYYTSSKLLVEGKDLSMIYHDEWFQQKIYGYGIGEEGKYSPFPPPAAFVMIPVASLSPLAAKRVFLLVNVIALLAAAVLITMISKFSYIGACNIILLSGAALSNNFVLGQLYLILLMSIVWGYRSFLGGKSVAAGIAWGVGAAVKYFPLIYIPAIIIKKDWKTLGALIFTFVFVTMAACMYFGFEASAQFFTRVLPSHLNGELSNQSNYAVAFQSWNSLLRTMFVYDAVQNPSPLFESVPAFQFSRAVIYAGFSAAAMIAIWRLRHNLRIVPYSIVISSLLVFVLAPASASYHVVLLVLPIVVLLDLSLGKHPAYSLCFIILFALIGFSPVLLHRMSRQVFGLFFMYNRLWLTVLLFITSVGFILMQRRRPTELS
jgi:hypothetical protein